MRIAAFFLMLTFLLVPVGALEIQAPEVPAAAAGRMPENTASFADGFTELVKKAIQNLRPDLAEAARVSLGIIAAALMTSILSSGTTYSQKISETAAVVCIAALMLRSTNALIALAADTVRQIMTYGKLLLPVMTTALAAQGSITASAALCTGTALFSALLQSVIAGVFLPGVYLYLALSLGSCAAGEDLLKRMGDLTKAVLVWSMKILLTVFTTWLGLTGIVSGTTDAAALKAAKVGISTFVPVVGGALSDASEAVLVSAGVMKNAAGIYGILAVLALFLQPFLKIAAHYLILKLTGALCAVFGSKCVTGMVDGYTAAMGLLLGMTASCSVLVLISTVCFLKGAA